MNEHELELPTVVQENKQFGCNTICGFEGTCLFIFLDSSMVEHSAVNRRVVGSSPTRGVWRSSQAVRQWSATPVRTGSNPVGVNRMNADVAQLAEQLICNQQVIGSSPIIGFLDL